MGSEMCIRDSINPIDQMVESDPSLIVKKKGSAGQVVYGLLTLKK